MEDTQTMKEMLSGLVAKKKRLGDDKDIFLRVAGINEEIEKANQDKVSFEKELANEKEIRDNLKKKKADAVSETTSKISEKMNSVLPFGSAILTYEEDENNKRDLHIGWLDGNVIAPYNGLSGMEKQVFDAALANVLGANIIVLEAAELDNDNLPKTLQELSKLDKQVIVNYCHPITGPIPGTFKVIEV